jgi:Tfp pilus assembly protein PilW
MRGLYGKLLLLCIPFCYIGIRIMVENGKDTGFTVAEMVVALVVLSLFLTLFFQLYFVSEAQRLSVLRRSAASDIARNNLQKISNKSMIPGGTAACDSVTTGAGNQNNQILNPNAPGSPVTWSISLAQEPTASMSLPSGTAQTLRVAYPRGCDTSMPVKIISTVTYGTETVSRAIFVN